MYYAFRIALPYALSLKLHAKLASSLSYFKERAGTRRKGCPGKFWIRLISMCLRAAFMEATTLGRCACKKVSAHTLDTDTTVFMAAVWSKWPASLTSGFHHAGSWVQARIVPSHGS